MLDGDAEADRVLHNLTGADLPSSALSSVTADRDWLVQMGVEMLNRGGLPTNPGTRMRPRGRTILVTRNLGRRAPTAHSLSSCAHLGQRRNFSPSSHAVGKRLGNEQPMLRIRADPLLAHVGPVDYRVRGAWCVVRVCVYACCRCQYIVVLACPGTVP